LSIVKLFYSKCLTQRRKARKDKNVLGLKFLTGSTPVPSSGATGQAWIYKIISSWTSWKKRFKGQRHKSEIISRVYFTSQSNPRLSAQFCVPL